MAALHHSVQRGPLCPIFAVDVDATGQSELDQGLVSTGGSPVDGIDAMFFLESDFVEMGRETEGEATARPRERAEVAGMVEIVDDEEKELAGEGEDGSGGGGG